MALLAMLGLVCALASFAWPFVGYLFLLTYGLVFVLETPVDAERRLRPVAA